LSASVSREPHVRASRNFSVHIQHADGHGLIVLWRRCDTLCTSGFVDDVMLAKTVKRNGPVQAQFREGSSEGRMYSSLRSEDLLNRWTNANVPRVRQCRSDSGPRSIS